MNLTVRFFLYLLVLGFVGIFTLFDTVSRASQGHEGREKEEHAVLPIMSDHKTHTLERNKELTDSRPVALTWFLLQIHSDLFTLLHVKTQRPDKY